MIVIVMICIVFVPVCLAVVVVLSWFRCCYVCLCNDLWCVVVGLLWLFLFLFVLCFDLYRSCVASFFCEARAVGC